MYPPSTQNRTPPPALPKKSASVAQMTGMMGGKSGSPSGYPNQRAQPGIPMPAGLKGPQMPGQREPSSQWKNSQPGFNPQNVSRKDLKVIVCQIDIPSSCKNMLAVKLNPLKQIFFIQIIELQRILPWANL